jgi:hypothetical protein
MGDQAVGIAASPETCTHGVSPYVMTMRMVVGQSMALSWAVPMSTPVRTGRWKCPSSSVF